MKDSWGFLIMAAGRGTRLGGVPKQFRTLGSQRVWMWSLDVARSLEVDRIVLVLPEDWTDDVILPPDVIAVKGGNTRACSVINGLQACDCRWVMIHDGARPFLSSDLCRRMMPLVDEVTGVVPVLTIDDAVKKIDVSRGLSAVDRSSLLLTQTPQVFHRESVLELMMASPDGVRDEAEPWIASGNRMATVEGERLNFKITTEGDWTMAQLIASQAEITRTGLGFDVHPLVPGRPLILGGVAFESPLGLDGHSDADLICHSIADGILGVAGLPDIGRLFPANEELYKGADSYGLLKKSIAIALNEGWEIRWVDVVLHAQIPRIGAKVDDIVANLNRAWSVDSKIVNLKVKSGEKIGSVGGACCMTCYASVTGVKRRDLLNRSNPL